MSRVMGTACGKPDDSRPAPPPGPPRLSAAFARRHPTASPGVGWRPRRDPDPETATEPVPLLLPALLKLLISTSPEPARHDFARHRCHTGAVNRDDHGPLWNGEPPGS